MTDPIVVPDVVQRRARTLDAEAWVEAVPELVRSLARDWSFALGRTHAQGTEAFVADATLADGSEAVLKLAIPRADGAVEREVRALELANGSGAARLLRSELARSALLLERLGPTLHELGLPIERRNDALCATGLRFWRPAPDCGLPTGADKALWLEREIEKLWRELERPCAERTVEHAIACARRRAAAHDDARAQLVHGDLHQWNTLRARDGFKLVDPDGLLAEPEYDLGIVMREDPAELLGDGRTRAASLAARTGLDAEAIWEWGVVERVSTGLVCTLDAIQPSGREMLAVADRLSGA